MTRAVAMLAMTGLQHPRVATDIALSTYTAFVVRPRICERYFYLCNNSQEALPWFVAEFQVILG